MLREVGFKAEVEVESVAYDQEEGLVCLRVVVCASRHTSGRLAPKVGERFTLRYLASEAQYSGLFSLTPLAEWLGPEGRNRT